MARDHDPGDAVPPGVAVETPEPLSHSDLEALHELERFGSKRGRAAEMERDDGEAVTDTGADAEVARETRTVQPGSDAPSRSGILGAGSGADGEGI